MPFSIDRPFSSPLGINLGGKLMSTSSWRSSWRKEIFTSNWYKGREKFAAIERITLKEFSFAKINQSHMLVNPSTTNLAFIPLESIHRNHLHPTACFLIGKSVNSHVPFLSSTCIFSIIAAFHFGCNKALDTHEDMHSDNTCEINVLYVGDRQL